MLFSTMQKLIRKINSVKKSPVRRTIDKRMGEFRQHRDTISAAAGKAGNKIFSELCFCLLTANYNAEGGIRIQNALGEKVCTLPLEGITAQLKKYGHRFPNARSAYICEARVHIPALGKELAKAHNGKQSQKELREWIVKNIKGLGYKEASHFLRNIGFEGLAIIDFHIIDILAEHKLVEMPKSKSLGRKKYLEIEEVLEKISRKTGLSLAELDLYLWFIETGKVLK
jgi:N-glycosylase/DNA lyase